MDSRDFEMLVLSILCDHFQSSVVMAWDRSNPGAILRERAYLGDENDAMLAAIRLFESVEASQ